MLIPLLLLALLVVGFVVAYVALGRARFEAAWDSIPGPVKTFINVFLYGSIGAVVAAVVLAKGVTGVDWYATGETALNAGALGVAIAIGRALAPWDDAYGFRKAKADELDLGAH